MSSRAAPVHSDRSRRNVSGPAALAMVSAALLAWLLKQGLDLSGLYLMKVVLAGALLAWLVNRGWCTLAHPVDFGVANQLTLSRAVLVVLLLGLLGEHGDVRVMWSAFVIASVASVTDALDGWLARRTATSSDFGARFDMETDAALIAVLALLAWYWERAGAWVLLAGAVRYVFALGVFCCRWMRRTLPPSLRRKVVCVVQIVALVLCMAPLVTPAMSGLLAAAGVSALLASFTIDTLWLARAAHHAVPEGPKE